MILFEIATIISLVIVIMGVSTKGRVFSYLANRVSSKANNLSEKMRDPRVENEKVLAEEANNIAEMKNVRITLREQRAKTVRAVEDYQHKLNNYDKAARKAGEAGNAEDVKRALLEMKKLQQLSLVYSNQLKEQDDFLKEITEKIDEATTKLEEAKGSSSILVAQLDYAGIRANSRAALDKFNNPGSGLDRLKLDVEVAKDHLAAQDAEEKEQNKNTSLLDKYSEDDHGITEEMISSYMKVETQQ